MSHIPEEKPLSICAIIFIFLSFTAVAAATGCLVMSIIDDLEQTHYQSSKSS